MSLVSGVVANLIAGVSQQPPPARAEGTTAHCVNAIPSVVTGLRKRPSSRIIAPLMKDDGKSFSMQIMDRGTRAASRIILGTSAGIRIFTLDGKEERVAYSTVPGQSLSEAARSFSSTPPAYLSGISDPEKYLGFTTVADAFYAFNRTVPVKMRPKTTSSVVAALHNPERLFSFAGQALISPTSASSKPPADFTQATVEAVSYISTYDDAPRVGLMINGTVVATVALRARHVGLSHKPRYYYATALSGWLGVLRNHVDFRHSEIINGVLHIRSSTIVVNSVGVTPGLRNYAFRNTPYKPPSGGTPAATGGGIGDIYVRDNSGLYATVIIKQSAPGTRYEVRFGGSLIASFTANAERPESITEIATKLTEAIKKYEAYDARVIGNLISIRRADGKKIAVVAATPTAFTTSYTHSVAKFTDLPPQEIPDRLVKVSPDPGNDASSYYVVYNRTTGRWDETLKPGTRTTLDPHTMPMIVTWERAYGVWWCRPEVWTQRKVGDSKSNPDPSFVGRAIESLFFVNNRMGLLSDENAVFSEEGEYTNFFRTSVTQFLDSDRIDVAAQAASNRVAYLRHAIPFEGGLALFADTAQFRLEYSDGLSPKNISIRPLSEYDCAPSVRPQRLGRNIVFASEQSGEKWSTIREFFIESLNSEPEASSLTEAVPEYIPAGIGKIATSSTLNHAAVFTRGNRNRLYFYSFHWANNTRVQSAWNYWEMPNTRFLNGEFFGKTLYLLTLRDGTVTLSSMSLEEDLKGDAFGVGVLLDNVVTEAGTDVTYYGSNSVLRVPYTPLSGEDVVCVLTKDGVDRKGTQYPVIPRGHSSYEVLGVDLRNQKFVIGTRYAFEFEISPVYARNDQGVPLQDGRLQLRSTSILCNTASAFEVRLQLPGRKEYVTDYSGIRLGSHESLIGHVPGDDGEFLVPTPGEPEKMRILIRNDTAFPSRFNAIEWAGIWRPRSRRRS